ncbi:phosphonate metabolism protein/1,5-bisphosphokinase (PRPP-forming) PhnN [Bradyrhizobium embrapense]|uniref:phosphonate metabolism protein/1,5-bisphosphokinase (PRPP-forming) PhnN n=1 Tax=Bradyrhizobium embrapense TaxID=630921 RepID=UPI00067D0322|nr:phosphonate metabolism protein/1,5-bisphosphokinase (PRPP-forming) PhnN [Bradyrhizobium embrapense]
MTDTPVIAGPRTAIGPGRLILVVGPSGAGKDTLLGLAKAACAGDRDIVFSRRLITRQASASEDNEEVGAEAFQRAIAAGDYAMHWEAHGHRYALSRAINDEIRAGRTVIANVSRMVIAAARRNYANALVVSVTAPPDVLAARLAARARSSDGLLAQRLARTVDESTSTPDFTIVNSGTAEYHARQLVRIIKGERWDG